MTLSYELAVQLKEAGYKHDWTPIEQGEDWDTFKKEYSPTLSELIEACGDVVLYTKDGKSVAWVAGNMRPHNPTEYDTPEEAVAKLYIALNT